MQIVTLLLHELYDTDSFFAYDNINGFQYVCEGKSFVRTDRREGPTLENAMKWPEGREKNTQIAGKVEFKDVHFSYVGLSDGAVNQRYYINH